MSSLGTFVLLATFVIACYAATASVVGARRRSSRLVESGIGAFYLTAAMMTVASGLIVHAFVTGAYNIKYVDRYSDSAQPLFYKITSYGAAWTARSCSGSSCSPCSGRSR